MDPAPRGIDEIRGRFHQGELLGTEQAKAFLGARAMHRYVIGLAQQVGKLGFDARLGR